ncbi:MAG TPA: 23S rRNA (guanosine(2251)-2'-O)-methyltransferase RlmB [Actinomycetota bacterium]|nr:23S rRNA (guanosine(2251)-2'-O)-methyltransferase RlmB [Actinomycetota bacterium]
MSNVQVEGRRPVIEALRSGRGVREVLLAEGVQPSAAVREIRELASSEGVPLRVVPRREIDSLSRSQNPQGVLAFVAPRPAESLEDVVQAAERAGQAPLLVALDGVTDPHNVGALARSAEAAGAHGLLLPSRRSAGVTPTVEKAAAGALAWLPVVTVDNLSRTIEWLKSAGIWTVALDGEAPGSLYDLNLACDPLCLVVGAEGPGVSRLVAQRCDLRVHIPLRGRVGSLNASVAGGVALFEVARRRSGGS